jgi:hypothetical protein
MSLEKLKYTLIRARSQISDHSRIQDNDSEVDAVLGECEQEGDQRTTTHVRGIVCSRCKLSIVSDFTLDNIHCDMLGNTLQQPQDSLREGWITVYHSGFGEEDGIVRSHVLGTHPMLGKHHRLNDTQ